jgi:hypothetical protein
VVDVFLLQMAGQGGQKRAKKLLAATVGQNDEDVQNESRSPQHCPSKTKYRKLARRTHAAA